MMDAGAASDDGVMQLSDPRILESHVQRIPTGFADRHWGDWGELGIVKNSVTLLRAEPGAGASTFCLQLLAKVARATKRHGLLVLSSEPLGSLKERASRLGLPTDDVLVAPPGRRDVSMEILKRWAPSIVVVDSAPSGSVVEVCRSTRILSNALPADVRCPFVVIGPVLVSGEDAPDEGAEAHDVDTAMILTMASEIQGMGGVVTGTPTTEPFRILRTQRSRFGGAHESFFTMHTDGLKPFELPKGSGTSPLPPLDHGALSPCAKCNRHIRYGTECPFCFSLAAADAAKGPARAAINAAAVECIKAGAQIGVAVKELGEARARLTYALKQLEGERNP
jgi:hypothetical protein